MSEQIEGRNAVMEAFRAGRCVDKLFILDGCQDGPVRSIAREARKHDTIINFVPKERLDQLSETGAHQGVIAQVAAYEYAEVEDILKKAEEKGEPPFIFLLDGIEDPHNLGSIIRTAELCGVHGIIIPKRRNVGVTSTVYKCSAGAVEHMRIAKVTNVNATIDTLKEKGIWIYGADIEGKDYSYNVDFGGPCAIVIGSEGKGISNLTLKKCDVLVKIPMIGKINSLNASVAGGIMMYEVLKSRIIK